MKFIIFILIGICFLLIVVISLFRRIPSNSHLMIGSTSSRTVTVSRTGISIGAKPEIFEADGLNKLEPFVGKLNSPSRKFQSLLIFTLDGEHGVGLDSRDGKITVGFSIDWRTEPERETAIRQFFISRGLEPSSDYVAGNGGVPDATRILDYEISGATSELTELLRIILQQLCGVKPTEAISVEYEAR